MRWQTRWANLIHTMKIRKNFEHYFYTKTLKPYKNLDYELKVPILQWLSFFSEINSRHWDVLTYAIYFFLYEAVCVTELNVNYGLFLAVVATNYLEYCTVQGFFFAGNYFTCMAYRGFIGFFFKLSSLMCVMVSLQKPEIYVNFAIPTHTVYFP